MQYSRNQIAVIMSCAVYANSSTGVPPALEEDLEENPVLVVSRRSRDMNRFWGTGSNKVCVYISRDHTELFVVFRGTEPDKLENLMQDMEVRLVDRVYHDKKNREWSVKVHSGFIKASELVCNATDFEYITQEYPGIKHITACGHSLGGAMSLLAVLSEPFAALLQHFNQSQCHVITIGCPKIGNDSLNSLLKGVFSTQTHFVNAGDPVADSPPAYFGYVPLISRTDLRTCGFMLKSHSCGSCYLKQLEHMR
jgi:hypothetical protein